MNTQAATEAATQAASTIGNAFMSGFNRLTSVIDSGITSVLRDFGTQVSSNCPKCQSHVAAPVGANVRCSSCGHEFSMGTAGEQAKSTLTSAIGARGGAVNSKDQELSMRSTLPGTISRSPLAS